jgi:hypothetical protein
MIGAKPWEFRGWNYLERGVGVRVNDRIGIHAGARPIKPAEIDDLRRRLDDPICSTGLIADKARVLLDRLGNAYKCRGVIELSALLGTVRIGEPKLSVEAMPSWRGEIGDSDRLEHCQWAWPMLDVRPMAPVPMKGWQGFFNVPVADAAA